MAKQEGTMGSPIALNLDGKEEKVGQRRKWYITVVEDVKKRTIFDGCSFHPEFRAPIEAKESWENSGQIPNHRFIVINYSLRHPSRRIRRIFMSVLFPSNLFTAKIKKGAKGNIFPKHAQRVMRKRDALRKVITTAGFEKAQEECAIQGKPPHFSPRLFS